MTALRTDANFGTARDLFFTHTLIGCACDPISLISFPFRLNVRKSRAVLPAGSVGFSAPLAAQDTRVDTSALKPLERFQECAACPEMIVMPPGAFMMGACRGVFMVRFIY